jgi:ketosteroid isomerase-like protein
MRIWVTFALLSALAMPARADLDQDVRCREVGFSRSVEAQDQESFSSFVDPDARFVGGRVDRGREAVTKAWAVFFTGDLPSIKWRPQIIEVLETGELALSRGLYRVIDKDESGEVRESWGTFNSVWRLNADGEWLVVFDAGSPSHESPPDEQRKLLESDAGCD